MTIFKIAQPEQGQEKVVEWGLVVSRVCGGLIVRANNKAVLYIDHETFMLYDSEGKEIGVLDI